MRFLTLTNCLKSLHNFACFQNFTFKEKNSLGTKKKLNFILLSGESSYFISYYCEILIEMSIRSQEILGFVNPVINFFDDLRSVELSSILCNK